MSVARDAALAYVRNNRGRFLEQLNDLLTIPSISTNPDHKADMQRAAAWLSDYLKGLGFDTEIFQTAGHPVVYASYLKAPAGSPTMLIYGHYDVQPPDPLDLWTTAPFAPSVRGENLYARGASDMKGQVLASLAAVEAVIKQGEPPVNFKFILEGEEEIGSPHLPEFMKTHASLLACDFVLNPDTGMISADIPTIVYALRGLAYFELTVHGPDHDLHSGSFGGVVHNPAQALCELIAGMHDSQGQVTLPGFYDRVRQLSYEEKTQLARLPMDADFYLAQTGAPEIWGEEGFTPIERTGARPTLEIHGLYSGFTGKGTKTVIPSWAMAKLSSRIVPDQQPDDVHQQLREYLEKTAPKTIRWELTYYGGGPACITDLDLPATHSLAKAMETVWGKTPVFKREGGSVPVVTEMQQILGVQSVLTGFGLSDDRAHSPNEKLHLPTWYSGQEVLVHFIYNLSA